MMGRAFNAPVYSGGFIAALLISVLPTSVSATIVFLSSGTTWTVPSDWQDGATIQVIGGGGGGGGGNVATGAAGGGKPVHAV